MDLSLRKDVFENVKRFAESSEGKSLAGEYKRYVERLLRDGRRSGLDLHDELVDKLKKIKKEISELGTDFRNCISEDTSYFYTEEKNLTGLTSDFIATLDEDENGLKKLTCKYPDYFPVMDSCSNPYTRRTMEKTYRSRCLKENTPRLERLVELRQMQAELLGVDKQYIKSISKHFCFRLSKSCCIYP